MLGFPPNELGVRLGHPAEPQFSLTKPAADRVIAGCEPRHTSPELDGLPCRAFLHRKARSRSCPRSPVRNDRDRPLLSLQRDSIGFVNSGVLSLASLLTVHERPSRLQK